MNKRNLYTLALTIVAGLVATAQTTVLANFNFNGSASYPLAATSTASNITASVKGSQADAAYSGTVTGTNAFVANTTAGNALSMTNTNVNTWTLTLGGSGLYQYTSYKIYFQSQRSSDGATSVTLAYSTDGSTYTNASTTASPGNGSFTEATIDLSAVTALNNQAAVYIKFSGSGATNSAGTLRIDNLEIQGTESASETNGINTTFNGAVTAPTLSVTGNASVNGSFTSGATTVSSLGNTGNLNVAGTTTLTGVVTTNTLNVSQINISQNIATPYVVTSRIVAPDTNGVHIGDSSMVFNAFPNPPAGVLQWENMSSNLTNRSISIGTLAKAYGNNSIAIGLTSVTRGPRSFALGYNVQTTSLANNAIALGSGVSSGAPMVNSIANSLAVGFNSTIPTLFVGPSSGTGTIGKVGIGTTTPNSMLDIKTYSTADAINVSNSSGNVLMHLDNSGKLLLGYSSALSAGALNYNTNYSALLHVNGNIIVGSTSVTNCNIWVSQTGWSDFVFDDDYKLIPLYEVEKFYKKNHHLPDVPTQKDIQEKGNNLGQTDVVLLQKIEELTLYMVEQQKRIETLEKKLAEKK